ERHGRRTAPHRRVPTLGLAHPRRGGKGRGGEDVDLIVSHREDETCVEAKRRSSEVPYHADRLSNTPRTARAQLPRDRPTVVVLDVPREWLEDPSFKAELGDVVFDFLRQTKSVNLVQLIGKFYVQLPGRRLVQHWRWRQPSPQPRHQGAGLGHLTRAIVVPQVKGADSRVVAIGPGPRTSRNPSRSSPPCFRITRRAARSYPPQLWFGSTPTIRRRLRPTNRISEV